MSLIFRSGSDLGVGSSSVGKVGVIVGAGGSVISLGLVMEGAVPRCLDEHQSGQG